MSPCCGQNTSINALTERKLGRCKICMRLSIVGMLLSNFLLGIILAVNRFHLLVVVFISLTAISFIVLSILHFIYYNKDKKTTK